ncbi:MAG: hypothetical protein KDD45_08835 [Bdellovibrionales bacterium]|nr:hypothetical protein [Bdellovibrionales bacterium]
MEDETKGIVHKMSKIDINKDEREAEIVIKRAMNQGGEVKNDLVKLVIKTIVDMKNKMRNDNSGIPLK